MAAPNIKPPPPPPKGGNVVPFGGIGGKNAVAAHRRRAPKKYGVSHAVHDDSEGNWLVSYADMMTLLLGFFVMLSAFSVPDASKMEALKKETSESMGGKYTKPFEQLSNSIQQTLQDIQLDKEVSVAQTDEGVTIVSKGTLFFDSGSSTMKESAATLMNKIADVLSKQAKDFRIIVEGHTDDSPIATKEFPSNWELSAVRAGSVVRLLEGKGLSRKNLRPIGLADTEPISPNRDAAGLPIPANQAENRRIVIRVQKQLPKRLGEAKAPLAPNGAPAPTAPGTPVSAAPAPTTAPVAATATPEAATPAAGGPAPASVNTAPLATTPVAAPPTPNTVPAAVPGP